MAAYFGVTAATMRAEYFPQWSAFDVNTRPSSTTITDSIIPQKYAELAGKLLVKQIAIASAVAATTDPPYSWCQETLGLMVAIRILQLATQRDVELAKTYQERLDDRLGALESYGATALGLASLDTGNSPSGGPTTYIEQLGLEVPDSSLSSGLAPFIRKDDPV